MELERGRARGGGGGAHDESFLHFSDLGGGAEGSVNMVISPTQTGASDEFCVWMNRSAILDGKDSTG